MADTEGAIRRFASGLKFPQLFLLTAALFVADLIFPDMIPFVDEMILGFLTALFALWKDRKGIPEDEAKPPIKDVTPPQR